MFLTGLMMGLIMGFIVGILFGRKNRKKVEEAIKKLKAELEELKNKG